MNNYKMILKNSIVYRAGTLVMNGFDHFIIYFRTENGSFYQALYRIGMNN